MILALILIVIALAERLWFDLGPNIELVMMASVVVGLYGPKWAKFVVPLVIMIVSDYFLGFGLISLFTWSGFMLVTWLPGLWKRLSDRKGVMGLMSGVSGTIWFYLWTNFGVWATDQWGMYAKDASGLSLALVNGLPFLRLQMTSTLLFVPLGILAYEMVKELRKKKKLDMSWGENKLIS